MNKLYLPLLMSFFFVLIMSLPALAQPGFPSFPSQAPIDGGLGILAAAGGAYAWKKLQDKKNH